MTCVSDHESGPARLSPKAISIIDDWTTAYVPVEIDYWRAKRAPCRCIIYKEKIINSVKPKYVGYSVTPTRFLVRKGLTTSDGPSKSCHLGFKTCIKISPTILQNLRDTIVALASINYKLHTGWAFQTTFEPMAFASLLTN